MTAEDNTSSLQVEIYSYYNCFHSCNKLRPAVRLPAGLFALSNSIPYKNPFIEIRASQVKSSHFKAKGKVVYLIKAEPSAYRYNNVSGGILSLQNPNEKKFLGLTTLNANIFSLSNNITMSKLLKIDFAQLKGATQESFGLSAESTFTPETAYDLCQRQVNGGEMSDEEKEITITDVWGKVLQNVQKIQLGTILPNLPFPNATAEMVAAIPGDKLNDAIEYAEAVMSGNPAEEGSVPALGVEGLAEWLGVADLTAYQTPAALEAVAAAIETAVEGAPVVETETVPATEETAPIEEGVGETEASPAVETPVAEGESLPVPQAQTATAIVAGGERYRSANVVVSLRQQVLANIEAQQKTLKQIDGVIVEGFLQNAALLDQQALPAGTPATEELVVEG